MSAAELILTVDEAGAALQMPEGTARARWLRREAADLELELLEPAPGLRFGTHIPVASRPNRRYLDQDQLTGYARERLADVMSRAVRTAHFFADAADELHATWQTIDRERRSVRQRTVATERYEAALQAMAVRPARSTPGRRWQAWRRKVLEIRHERYLALLREIEWNFHDLLLHRLGFTPPSHVIDQLKQRHGIGRPLAVRGTPA